MLFLIYILFKIKHLFEIFKDKFGLKYTLGKPKNIRKVT